jgi:prevent-host-death family protein
MKKVPLAEFKAHCSRYVDEVAEEEILITKHGKPVARLSPAEPRASLCNLRGILKGELLVDPDDEILSTGIRWDAES